jgi:hypothetical protein
MKIAMPLQGGITPPDFTQGEALGWLFLPFL